VSAHNSHELGLMQTLRQWWKESQARAGFLRTARSFAAAIWGFARESMPERRRRRYGDVDFDWDYRVDTTSATVGWRNRLLGTFHSPYQPTGPTVEKVDDRFDYGEVRVYAVGLVNGLEITVVYADENDNERRISSAWRAEPHERRSYWQNIES
jgi:hypothetical protein